ncbi:hypothetical protein RV10_GL000622 [Enterococcus pallens]|nr:hypothetical protein RV10_GL000622 [Enterococcus pallens]
MKFKNDDLIITIFAQPLLKKGHKKTVNPVIDSLKNSDYLQRESAEKDPLLP